jgi:hypothetical protein
MAIEITDEFWNSVLEEKTIQETASKEYLTYDIA